MLAAGCAGKAALTGALSQAGSSASTHASGASSSPSASSTHSRAAGEGIAGAARKPGAHKNGAAGLTGTFPSATARDRSGVAGGTLFGGNEALTKEQGQLGRKLAIVRSYHTFGDSFPSRADRRVLAGGNTLLVSLDTLPGGATYNSIAAGQHDGYILSFLRSVNSAAVGYHLGSIYMSFEHEVNFPNHHQGLGTPAEFVQAWDHIHQLAVAAHLDWQQGGRLHWVLILSHHSYAIPTPAFAGPPASSFWPGNNEVDIVGADGYDSFGCGKASWHNPTTPSKVFGPVVRWAAAHGNLPVFIAEWGVANALTGAQLTYVQQMDALVSKTPEIAAALYWDSPGIGCSYTLSGARLGALSVMGHSGPLQGRIVRT